MAILALDRNYREVLRATMGGKSHGRWTMSGFLQSFQKTVHYRF